MAEVFGKYLGLIQGLQRIFLHELGSFSITTKYDDYFEEYLEVEIRTDNNKYFMTTYNCVDESEYAAKYNELMQTMDKMVKNVHDEQEGNIY